MELYDSLKVYGNWRLYIGDTIATPVYPSKDIVCFIGLIKQL
ncbi:MAG: hypothetical protein RXR07_09905 [Sulfolobaceae archaeon]